MNNPSHNFIRIETQVYYLSLLLVLVFYYSAEGQADTKVFAPETVSTGNIFKGSFTPDGNALYYFKKTGEGEAYQIFKSKRSQSGWGTPEVVELGKEASNLYPSISPSGEYLVFVSYRDTGEDYEKNAYLWISKREKNSWGEPVFVDKLSFKKKYHSNLAWTDDNELVYRVTEEDGVTSYTYITEFSNGSFDEPQLYQPVEQFKDWNNSYYLWGGVPGLHENHVILDVSKIDSAAGRAMPSDQWHSFRQESGSWSTPRPIQSINAEESWDTFVFFSPDRKQIYFVRDFDEIHFLPSTKILQTSGFAPSSEVEIHYRIFGSGEPLLVINGGPGFSSEGFSDLAKQLSDQYQVILYDQRGTGKSKMTEIDSTNMTMDLMVKDMEALRTHLGLAEWTILGHSFGGIMANYYTSKHPERVTGIIASSSGGIDLGLLEDFDFTRQLSSAERDSLRYWTNRVNEGDTTAYADQKRREYFADAYVYNDEYIPVVAERMTQSNPAINGLIWADLRRIGYDVSEELSTFEKPVLIIQGKQDILQERTARKAADVFSNAELILLDRCGHYGWLDRPKQYFGTIFSFLQTVS